MKDYYVTLKVNGVVRRYHAIALDIFDAWQQLVSIYGGVVCD